VGLTGRVAVPCGNLRAGRRQPCLRPAAHCSPPADGQHRLPARGAGAGRARATAAAPACATPCRSRGTAGEGTSRSRPVRSAGRFRAAGASARPPPDQGIRRIEASAGSGRHRIGASAGFTGTRPSAGRSPLGRRGRGGAPSCGRRLGPGELRSVVWRLRRVGVLVRGHRPLVRSAAGPGRTAVGGVAVAARRRARSWPPHRLGPSAVSGSPTACARLATGGLPARVGRSAPRARGTPARPPRRVVRFRSRDTVAAADHWGPTPRRALVPGASVVFADRTSGPPRLCRRARSRRRRRQPPASVGAKPCRTAMPGRRRRARGSVGR
jgi:hypothetical protein